MTFIFPWRSSIFRKSNKYYFVFLDYLHGPDKVKYFVDELEAMHINHVSGICQLYMFYWSQLLYFTWPTFSQKYIFNHCVGEVGMILMENQAYIHIFWEKSGILTFMSG